MSQEPTGQLARYAVLYGVRMGAAVCAGLWLFAVAAGRPMRPLSDFVLNFVIVGIIAVGFRLANNR